MTRNAVNNDMSIVPARMGKAIRLTKGQALKITSIHGHQVVDTWAFNANDIYEYSSMEHTRAKNAKYFFEKGDSVITNKRRPVLVMEEDTSRSKHDTMIAACDSYRYSEGGCTTYHENCTDNLYIALREIGISMHDCPSPLNLWMNFPIDAEGKIHWSEPTLKKNDYIILRAAMDTIVVLSCCPFDLIPIHGDGAEPTEVGYSII
ncbi:DUF1989 domain-containing protein [Castellaniella sp.]|uniref:DUF1989 domain-containing protein n=1 Tax=Castellaniella sp. TaxID=1955812 RepID=UPI00355DDFF9